MLGWIATQYSVLSAQRSAVTGELESDCFLNGVAAVAGDHPAHSISRGSHLMLHAGLQKYADHTQHLCRGEYDARVYLTRSSCCSDGILDFNIDGLSLALQRRTHRADSQG